MTKREDNRHSYKSFKLNKLEKMISDAQEDIELLNAKREALICAIARYREAHEVLSRMIDKQKKHMK